ncbi:homocysteine S-methyltransferase [Saxibacter everestensis]|uniref:Homocysteine S-methyltransferase n=1 Tax=Saxibacter everestensis TaxID=2909229 RepID=A0ABY8QUA6_9MICO|nr:homocysteine S-methyltransferase [Brevibacteriaceae bacterium ZFBP1038]
MSSLNAMLAARKYLVLDGALGTELTRRGEALDGGLWSAQLLAEKPGVISAVHRDYLDAGADIILTSSYQATLPGLKARGYTNLEAEQLLRSSLLLAKHARDEASAAAPGRLVQPIVATSIGPYGAYLADGSEYRGDDGLTVRQLAAFHRPRIEILAEAGSELFACETIPSAREAEALLSVLADFPEIDSWLTFSARDGARISDGTPLADCARMAGQEVSAIGVNCVPAELANQLVAVLRNHTSLPIVAYPNSGELWDAGSQAWLGTAGRQNFDDVGRGLYQAGAAIIGGCCRTTPRDIEAVALALAKV